MRQLDQKPIFDKMKNVIPIQFILSKNFTQNPAGLKSCTS